MRWPTSLASLRHRNYRLLSSGTAMTQTGQWAQQVATAVALNSAGLNVTRTVGPAAAGLLIVSVGVTICFFLQAIGLFFSYWTSVAMRFPPREATPSRASPTADLREGWGYIRATPA